MGRTTWIRTGLCLLAVLVLLCMGLVLAEENPAVSLRINGEDSAVDLLLRESAAVEISAPGATAMRFMLSEDYWVELAEWGEWEEWSQSGEIRFDWDDWEGAVYAQACFDTDPSSEEAVWVRSNTVDVNLTTLGNLQAHTIEHADLVQRGELLEVRVQDLDVRADWTYASVFTDTTLFHQDRLGDQFYIPTAQFAPGTYNIGVGSRKVGYEDYWTEDTFTVTEPENGGIVFAIDKKEVVNFEDFTVSVYAPGADEVKLFEGEWEIDWRDCDTYVEHHSHGEATELHFHAEAHMPETGEWVSSESITVNVTAPYGDLAPFEIQGMPGQIAQLEAVSGTIVPVEGAQWYSLSFGISRGDGEWEWFETHDQEVNNTTINYDGHWFDEVGVYRLNVGAHARGMSSSYAEAYIVVQPEEDKERVRLSIGGETEVLNCVANTQLPLVVIAPGASDVQYFDGYGWRGLGHLENEIGYSGSESFNGGDYSVVARAWFDELGEWRYSNPVTVHAETTGEVGELNLRLSAERIARGDVLEVSFDAAENATEYNLHIWNERDWSFFGRVEPGTYSLPTAMLVPGEYYVYVDYCGAGCGWRNAEQKLTVTEGIEPEGIIASLSANEVACSKRVILSVYAPGAEMIRIYDREDAGDEEWNDERDGDTFIQSFNWNHPETLHFTASACYNGEWSARVEIGEVRVIESPQLDKPEIALSSSLINAGEDVVFSFDKVENATQYWYELRDNDVQNGNDQLMDGWFYAPATVKLPASLFRAGHTYRLEVHVGAPGYETSDVRYSLAVRPEIVDGDINLYVNGKTEAAEGWVSDGIHVVADAPENATAIIVSDGLDWRWQPGNHFEDDFWYDFNGEVVLIARYITDEINPDGEWWREVGWAGYSNPVTLTIQSNGSLPAVEADVPESVMRGEIMKIALTNADAFRGEGIDGLRLHAEAYSPDEDFWYGQYDWDGEGAIALPTAELATGRSYELHLRADAYGWIGSESVYAFEVTEPEGGILLDVDKTDVITNEDFMISVYAPGADQLKLFEGREEMDSCDGDAIVGRHSRGEAGEYRFRAEAHYPDEREWVVCDEIVVNVTAPYGDIAESDLALSMPSRLNAGEELTISWQDFDLRHYDVDIVRIRDDVRVWHSWNEHGETEVTVPLVMPEEYEGMEPVLEPGTPILEAGEFYRVNINFQREGYNNLYIERQIVVVSDDMYAEGLTLFVDGQTDACTIPVNTDVPVRITAPQNATAILAWNGYGWDMYTGNEVVTNWGWGDANEHMLYARYTTDEIVDGKDWPEYRWSRVSNIVGVTATAKGRMPGINAIVPESVMRGKLMEIQIENPSDLHGYDGLWLTAEAHFWNEEEDSWYGRFDWDGEGAITLPTAELPSGRGYELYLRACASGYLENESVYAFEVTEPEGGILLDVDKTDVITNEDFMISVYAPGADQVKLYEGDDEMDSNDGDAIVGGHSRGEAGEYRFHAEAHYPDERGWVVCDEIVVNVTAPYGDIAESDLELSMPGRLGVGEELTISWQDFDLRHYDVDIVRIRDDVRVWHSWNEHGETEVTVPLVMPEEYEGMEPVLEPGTPILEAGEFYRVNINFQREGYNNLYIERQIVVVSDDMYAEGLTLFVDGQTDACTIPVNTDVPVRITAPQNATAILVWNGYGWEIFEGNEVETVWWWHEAGERLLYARYASDTYYEDKDWLDYDWSGLSNVVTVNVTKLGDMPVPVVELSDANPLRGDVISFTVQNTDDFDGFHWTVRDALDGSDCGWRDWEGNARHEIDTFHLESDRSYLLCVNNSGYAGMEATGVEIPFAVRVNGQAEAPVVEVAGTVARGDLLNIRIKNPEAGDRFRAWFLVNHSDAYANVEWDGQNPISLPTFELEPGCENIQLYVANDGSYGMDRAYTILPIEVTEPSGDLSLYVENTSLVTQQQTYIVAFASGAERIHMTARHNDDSHDIFWESDANGDLSEVWQNFTGRAGAKLLIATATYPDGSTQTRTVEVNVTAPEGDLPEPVIDAPDSVEPGAELNFSVTAHNAEWWFVEVCDQTDEGRQLYHWDVENYEESRDFTVPADELVEGHTYGINVYAARYAWNEVGAYREFTVAWADDPYAENVMYLPAALSAIDEEAFEGISARTVVIPDGTTSIGPRAFADCENLKYVEIPDSVTSIAGDAFVGSDVTFICNDGSTACAYAQEHGIPLR